MSAVLDAFESLLDAQEFARGYRPQAVVDSMIGESADVLVGTNALDPIIVAGGLAEAGGLEIQMRVSDFSQQPTKNGAATIDGGDALSVLGVNESAGVYRIQIGDPTAND